MVGRFCESRRHSGLTSSALQFILEQSRQNRAPVSVPELKTRCRFLERTKIRSTIRHRDLVRVQFSNPRRMMSSQGSSTIPRAKLLSKHRPTRDHRLSSPQKSVGPDVNRSNRQWADLDQQETARTELLQSTAGRRENSRERTICTPREEATSTPVINRARCRGAIICPFAILKPIGANFSSK